MKFPGTKISIWCGVSVAVIAAIVHIGVLGHGFLYHWDDQWVVINRYTDAGLTWDNLVAVLTTFHRGQYAPVNELSYMTLHTFFGYDALVFHLLSLLWHTANAVCVYVFIRLLLEAIGGMSGRKVLATSWLTAILFAVNPVTVEPVSWVSASKILNYSFFYLLCLTAYMRYIKTPATGRYILVLLLFILAFGCKEQAVVIPLTLLLIDYVTSRRGKWTFFFVEKIPFFLLSAFFSVLTVISQGHSAIMPEYGLGYRIIFGAFALCEYAFKSLLPVNLCYVYPFPCQPGEAMPLFIYAYPLFVAIAAYVLYQVRNNKEVVFGVLFFVINLLTALHIVSMSRYVVTADRYVYLSVPGMMLIVAWAIVKYGCRFKIIIPAAVLYAGYFIGYTVVYTREWRDSDTLKSHVREILDERKAGEVNQQ